ncbi:CatB-related O-acetyltransferase [Salinimicrobium sp. MT39]|uniref:CatB-related O-acetyltransferase n=1 Tax=Salinimicrobium profundisediminis TaxID=2994553 RepID=A0A9X3CWH0_9FLAO|nr:CatB-related O-acetyltransferase [Salinimicrobium profundisediminis]MCX2837910.1 CatB-related O-acetyltransferase [Salinimicrobium profundisediminis]
MLGKIKTIISNYLFRLLRFYNYRKLTRGSYIDNSAYLNQVNLKGKIWIGRSVRLVGGVYVSGNVEIDDYTSINGPNLDIISGINKVKIGKFCSIARNVSIQEFNHKFHSLSTYLIFKRFFNDKSQKDLSSKGDIIIGNDVWIGAHSVILSGVKIGNGAVIAANTVITKDVPNYAIVGGNPGKIIKYRFDEEIQKELERIKWWDWDEERIKRNKSLFENDLTIEKIKNIV